MARMTANSEDSCQPREGPDEESWDRLQLDLVGKKFSTPPFIREITSKH